MYTSLVQPSRMHWPDIFLITCVAITFLVLCCCFFTDRRDVDDQQLQQPPPPLAQPVPVPAPAPDLEIGLAHHHPPPPKPLNIPCLEIVSTPLQCRQYLSQGGTALVSHQQYKSISSITLFPSSDEEVIVMDHRGSFTDCVICLAEFEAADACIVLGPCMHVFHQQCAKLWLRSHLACPVCRSPVDLGALITSMYKV